MKTTPLKLIGCLSKIVLWCKIRSVIFNFLNVGLYANFHRFFTDILVWLLTALLLPLQHRSYSVCMSFVRLGHHNG